MSDHRYFSKKHVRQPISRAIAKYGWENFSVEVLKECSSEEDMNTSEIEYIKQYQALDGTIGYNIFSDFQNHGFTNSDHFRHAEKIATQGRKSGTSKYSKYVGTRLWGGKWYCQCIIDGKSVSKLCGSETEAAELYDKICLVHYGKNCKLNFEEKREQYLATDLQSIIKDFTNDEHTSKEEFVCFDATRNRWVFSKVIDGKKVFKRFKTEEEAVKYKRSLL